MLGLLAAVELADRVEARRLSSTRRTSAAFSPRGLRGVALQISPPFVITEEEIATAARVFGEALDAVA